MYLHAMLEAASLATAYKAACVHAACCESQHRMLQIVYNHKTEWLYQVSKVLLPVEAIYSCSSLPEALSITACQCNFLLSFRCCC